MYVTRTYLNINMANTWATSPTPDFLKVVWTFTLLLSHSLSSRTHTDNPPSRCAVLLSVCPWAHGQGGQFAERPVLLLRGKRWTLRCLDRWSLRANFFSQTMHWYGFTPEWERRCRDSSSDRENLPTRQTGGDFLNQLFEHIHIWIIFQFFHTFICPHVMKSCVELTNKTALSVTWEVWSDTSISHHPCEV